MQTNLGVWKKREVWNGWSQIFPLSLEWLLGPTKNRTAARLVSSRRKLLWHIHSSGRPDCRAFRKKSRVIARSHKELCSGKTGKLCIETCSGVSTLAADPIAVLIGQSDSKPNYWLLSHHVNTSTSQGWMDELRSDQCLWQNTFNGGGETGKWLSLQSARQG